MADDKSMADRLLDPVRKAGEQIRNAGEQMRNAGTSIAENSAAVNLKVLDHAEKNASEAFSAMRAAAGASNITQVIEIQTSYVREQAARSMLQAREVGEIIASFGRAAIAPLTGKKSD